MEVLIDLAKLDHNIAVIQAICRHAGVQAVWVTKGCHSHPAVVDLLASRGAAVLGDVYADNLGRIRDNFAGELQMIQPPSRHQLDAALAYADTLLVSSVDNAAALAQAARRGGHRPRLILMVDVGNLREGVLPDAVAGVVTRILELPHVDLIGLGTSVGCFGGYLASERDLQRLVHVAATVSAATGHHFRTLSAGSGTMLLELAAAGSMPPEINQLRIGAAFLVGDQPPTGRPLPALHQDAFLMRGEILELARKPSLPQAPTGSDAFGRTVAFEDLGERNRALLDFGMTDVDVYALTPRSAGVRVLGATSNYTICDVTECPECLRVGSHLDFRMAYSAMARAMASVHTPKTLVPTAP
jgi:predicted amino acid racemase